MWDKYVAVFVVVLLGCFNAHHVMAWEIDKNDPMVMTSKIEKDDSKEFFLVAMRIPAGWQYTTSFAPEGWFSLKQGRTGVSALLGLTTIDPIPEEFFNDIMKSNFSTVRLQYRKEYLRPFKRGGLKGFAAAAKTKFNMPINEPPYKIERQVCYYFFVVQNNSQWVNVCFAFYDSSDVNKFIYPILDMLDQAKITACTESPQKILEEIATKKRQTTEDELKSLTDQLKHNPKDLIAYLERSKIYVAMKQFDAALKDLDNAIKQLPDGGVGPDKGMYSWIYFLRGEIFLERKQYDQAVLDFSSAIKMSKENVALQKKIYFQRGYDYFMQTQYDKALQDYNSILTLEPDNAMTHLSCARIYIEMKKYEPAMTHCEKAIRAQPDLASAYEVRGEIRTGMKQYEQALQDYRRAIGMESNSPDAYLNSMEVCILTFKPDAFKQWQKEFEAAMPEGKLSSTDLCMKLYLTAINRYLRNESVTELETRIDGLRADSRFSAGRFNNIIDWLNSKENSLSAQQKDYIRQLTAKVKSPDRRKKDGGVGSGRNPQTSSAGGAAGAGENRENGTGGF